MLAFKTKSNIFQNKMMRLFSVDASLAGNSPLPPATQDAINAAAAALLAGGVVVFPTDTVYGLAAHPNHPKAIERIFQIKGRPDSKPIALLASDLSAPARFGASMPPLAHQLASRFWPGALTLVLDTKDSAEGFRIPAFPLARAIIAACGGLLRVTSANLSGHPASNHLSPELAPVCNAADVVIDAGLCPGGVASTVAKISADNSLTILRQGAIFIQ